MSVGDSANSSTRRSSNLSGSGRKNGGGDAHTHERKSKSTKTKKRLREPQIAGDSISVSTSTYFAAAVGLGCEEWPLLSIAFACLLLSSAANLMLPRYKGQVIQGVIDHDNSGFQQDVKIFVGLSIITGFFGAIRNICFRVVGRKISCSLRNRLFRSIIKQDIGFFDATSTGQLTARLTNDASAMVSPIRTMLNSLLTSIISVVGGLVLCFWTSWKLSVLAFTSIGPIIYLTGMYAQWSKSVNKQIWSALGDANAVATEAICNIRTVRAFSTESLETSKYETSTNRALQKGMVDALVGGGTYFITNGLDLGAGALILWYGGTVAMDDHDQLTIGELVTFQLYWAMINSGYKNLNGMLNSFTRAAGAAQRVNSLLDSLPDIDTTKGVKLRDFNDSIVLKDIDFHYEIRPDKQVLSSLSLEIKKGQVVALVGPSGGGKSTIIRLLMRFYDPVSGGILVDSQPMRDVNIESLHHIIGVVTQETQLFCGSILENIAYGVEEPDRNQVIHAAQLANAHDFITGFEDGYETRVGERGVRLSGGQKQRIAIARVLMRKPQIVLLDEATSALDAESEALVQEALDRLIASSGATVVLVAHRLSTVVNADKIAVVCDGRIKEHGTHDQLLEAGGVFAQLMTRQITKRKNQIGEMSSGSASSSESKRLGNGGNERRRSKDRR
eukprot:CAMPEP_0197542724 /NCGR_PEP_ID=MMETSP1318-20131121/67858_1 /TAXON_ID=552666 /ORGANISM="Partenskyella glossopodia, Strain RCC365" /LENGTH=671 /DNA_ID=CAMNT_0043102009 /DNA_START=183 /DNA_END=2201 /DNA_ORIENTATION=-